MAMMPDWHLCIATPRAWLQVSGHEKAVYRCRLASVPGPDQQQLPRIAREAKAQLLAYLENGQSRFDIALQPEGTEFQQRVWQALLDIPAGETRTYADLAKLLDSSPRAVGGACRRNPIALIIPCHRVVARDGPGGYAGQTSGPQLAIKQWLLQHET